MRVLRAWVIVMVLLSLSTVAQAAPMRSGDPEKCPDVFTCGALAAGLAGSEPRDFAGAVRASKRQCEMSPDMGCTDYASMLIFVGPRFGDPPRGFSMLEAKCKQGYRPACSQLAREYERPGRFSGVTPQPQKAIPFRLEGCNRGDAMECSALADIYLAGGPAVPKDMVKAREMLERGCGGTDHYASGICSSIADKIMKGVFGRPSVKEAMPYLEKGCKDGYRCDLGFTLAMDGSPSEGIAPDFEKAKLFAKASCDRHFSCADVKKLEKRDPAWVKAQLEEACAKKRQWACDDLHAKK